jgi:glycosyltransferase involved in cell wall biosynthesis
MIIGIDANEANVSQRVGSNVYAFEVLKQLYRQGKGHEFIIYLSSAPRLDLPKETNYWHYRVIGPGFFWTQWRLPLSLFFDRPRPQVLLTLGHYAPRVSPVPTMICIMDLAFLIFPETFKRSDLWKLTNWTEYSAKRAKHIFTISQASKKDIINSYGIKSDKISVAYPGVDKPKVIGKSPVKGKYLLYIGTLQPRKNIDALIDAFISIKGMSLVIAGKMGWKYQPKKVPGVKYLGYVPDEKLGTLIKNSLGLVLPSLYEGFGIPVVQTMSLGIPVLVSRNSSLTEIVGDNGLYIEPPFDVTTVRDGLKKLLSLPSTRKQELTTTAKLRSQEFSWKNTGKTILEKLTNNW